LKKRQVSGRRLVRWAAIFSILVLVAHAVDAPDHLNEWWGYGTFFVIIGAFQFFLGLALFLQPWQYTEDGGIRPQAESAGAPYFRLGLILSIISIVVYIVTRTTGLPFLGPEAVREPVTGLSLIPSIVNLLLSGCFGWLIIQTRAGSAGRPNPRMTEGQEKMQGHNN
jgi:peptidoglycan/LPS O-acetylase OafA/YrhL